MKTLDALVSLGPAAQNHRAVVIAFPPAGAGATFYSCVVRYGPERPRFYGVQYPGRQARLLDDVVAERRVLVDEATEAIRELGRAQSVQEITLVGHSLGAQVAFETALRLQHDTAVPLTSLVLSARDEPGQTPAAGTPDPEVDSDTTLLSWLHGIGGVPDVILDNPELTAMVARALRADLRASACSPAEGTLDLPLLLVCGADDPITSLERMRGWADRSVGKVRHLEIPGGHDALRTASAHWAPLMWAEGRAA